MNRTPTAELLPIGNKPADARLVAGPRGTKILMTPAASRAMKAKSQRHTGLKVVPPLPENDIIDTDAEEGKSNAG
jgi:hypothetical protein